MPTKTTSYTDKQYQYILNSADPEQGFSDRVQELLDLGINAERGDSDE